MDWSMTRSILATTLATVAVAVAAAPASAGAHACGAGDPPLRASSHTSCHLAPRILNRVYRGALAGHTRTISVRSPVTHMRYRIRLLRVATTSRARVHRDLGALLLRRALSRGRR